MSLTDRATQLALPLEWQQDHIDTMIANGDILPLPPSVTDRDGKVMHVAHDRWVFNLGPSTNSYTWSIESPLLNYTLRSFAINRAIRTSAVASWHAAKNLPKLLQDCNSYELLADAPDLVSYRVALVQVMIELADRLKRNQTYWRYWTPAAWYKWGATRTGDLGFDESFAQRINSLKIPGGPKGVAVRSGDPLLGPLDPELERPLIQLALMDDTSTERTHLQQKLAIALSLAFGRNPKSLRLLFEDDFRMEADASGKTVYILSIPSIKKRKKERSELTPFEIGPTLTNLIQQVIESNRHIKSEAIISCDVDSGIPRALGRPLFMRRKPSAMILESADYQYALTFSSCEFDNLLKRFIARHHIVSPITSELLHVTSRRMRYTFATDMVDMGLSKAELAIALGHTDTQNVRVYFDIGTRIVPHLEKAAAGRIEHVINMFTPTAFQEASTTDRAKALTRLAPPISCYLCPSFLAYREAAHIGVLQALSDASGNGAPAPDVERAIVVITKLIGNISDRNSSDE